MSNIKKIFGIDTLYFFFETNDNYDELYLDILDQLEDIKAKFQKKDIDFENKDLTISINDIQLTFLGTQEGFYWFKDANEHFRIGFKDKYKNRGLNDIRVQLQGNGIYTFGINSIIELLKDSLKEYVTNYMPVTRADLNCFIQYDFSFISKYMFSTRKRKYSTISEIGDANTTQTLYVGKEPFKLRIYNKSLELKKSKKIEIMNEYFLSNGFNLEENIFNVEFQMNRTHLKQYSIDTINDLFVNAKNLFQSAMNDIRLLDISSVSKERLENNKYQASTHFIWEEIKQEYNIKEFLQLDFPLERLKRKISIYDENKFQDEFVKLIRKAIVNNLPMDSTYIDELYLKAKESINKRISNPPVKKDYIEVDFIDENSNKKESFRLINNKLVKPIKTQIVAELNDYDLLVYLDETSKKQHLSKKDKYIHYVAHKEAKKRNLVLDIEGEESGNTI